MDQINVDDLIYFLNESNSHNKTINQVKPGCNLEIEIVLYYYNSFLKINEQILISINENEITY